MKPPDWDRIQEIYHSALAQPRSERDVFISQACAGDPTLLRQVEALLEADSSPDGFLDSPVISLDPVSNHPVENPIEGRNLVEKEIGQRGISRVYHARAHKLNRQPIV